MTPTVSRRLSCLLLALLVLAVGALRHSRLADDRTWFDENSVLLQGLAIPLSPPWPPIFQRDEVYPAHSLADVLSATRSSAYPPGLPALLFLFRHAANPIRTMHGLVFAAGLTLPVLAYVAARPARDPWCALLAAAYVASSALLTQSSHQIKWNTFAQVPSLAAAVLLLRWDDRAPRWIGSAYAAMVSALVYIHYFGVWILPGHGLYVLAVDRRRLHQWLIACAVVVAAIVPWYVFSLAEQVAFVGAFYDDVARSGMTDFNRPVGISSVVRAIGYDLVEAFGFGPSSLKARYFTPVLLLTLGCVAAAMKSPLPERRALGLLAATCFGCGVLFQTLYAVKVGSVLPLQPHYLSPWVPLLMVAAVVGAAETGPLFRVGAAGVILGLSAAMVVTTPTTQWIDESPLPRDYSGLCRAVLRRAEVSTALVFESDLHAKLVNVGCPITGVQAVGAAGMRRLPASIRRTVVVERCLDQHVGVPEDWVAEDSEACVANTRLMTYRRTSF